MNGFDFLARHVCAIAAIVLVLVIGGVVSALSLPVGLFPQVAFPRVVVDLDAGDRPADQTAQQLTRPVEEAIRTVPGVIDVRSETTRGSAQISVDFGWGRDMTASTLLVDSAIARTMPSLPTGSSYDVRRMDPTVYPIIAYALQPDARPLDSQQPNGKPSEGESQAALRDFAQYQIVPLLASVPGLSHVDVQGGDIEELQVEVDPQRLAAHDLAFGDVVTAVAGSNVLQAVGRVQDRNKLYLAVASHSLRDAAAIGAVVVKSDPAGLVRLADVAEVHRGPAPQWMKVSEDGRPAVLFNVYEQPDGNAVRIAEQVRAKLATLRLPQGVSLTNWYDQSELVTASEASVRDAVAIGLLLAAAVMLLFLRNLRVTLMAMLVVPATLTIAVLLLDLLGMSFNIMTLGGIAAAVGLVIDDVIVMVEHIARRAGGGEDGEHQVGVLAAAREFMRPLTASSLATLIVFVPLGFLDGVTGAFAKALSLTMACALGVSYLMAAVAVPLIARHALDLRRWRDPWQQREGRWRRYHAAALHGLTRRPWLLAVLVLPLLLLGAFAYRGVATGFMPEVDESGFVMDYYTAPGTSLTETSRQVAQVEQILRATPEVATFSRRLGTGLGGDLGQSYHGDFFVRLKAGHARATEEVMSEVRERVEHDVPGVEVELAQLMEDLIGDLTAVPEPIEIKLFATDPSRLDAQAERVAAAIRKIDGVVEVKSGVQLAGDALNIDIDPARAAFEGMTPDAITQAVNAALSGVVATQSPQPDKSIAVRVWVAGATRMRIPQLEALSIRAPDGHLFPLSRVASLTAVSGQPQISRENLQPMVAVTGRIEGRGIGAAIADVKAALAQPGLLTPDTRYELGGLYRQQQIAFLGLGKVFGAALAAECILLLFLYRSVRLAAIVIGCALLSPLAVYIALWLTGVDLNITALMGMTMIIGIGAEMAIFYVSEYLALAQRMPPAEAALAASRDRLRPISMTTLAAILTLLPLALAIGQGAGIQQPLAIAIIAGLLLQYPLVLLAMPVLIGLSVRRAPA